MNEKLDFKFVLVTFILLMVLIPVFSIIHEYGHALACASQGRAYLVGFGFSAWSSCEGKFDDPTFYRLAGGFLGASVALTLFAGLRTKLVGKYKPIAIVLVTIGFVEYINMIQEGLFNDFYMTFGSAVSGMVILLLTIILVFRHSPRRLVRA